MEWPDHLKAMKVKTRDRVARLQELLQQGVSETQASAECGWRTYEAYWRFKDWHKIKDHVDAWKEAGQIAVGKRQPIKRAFADFCRDILGQPLYPHMEQWREWMEDPEADHVLITTRPESGKSSFIRNYALYRICEDPTIRITIASAAKDHAIKQVSTIRAIIESNVSLARAYGHLKPSENQRHYPWSNEKIMVSARSYQPGDAEADPTLQAVGLEGQIEGVRADLFVIDDADQQRNTYGERGKIFHRIITLVEDRLTVGSKLIIANNRWDTNDVSAMIVRQESEEPGLWKIHTTPAIKRWADPKDPDDWGEVLWPEKFGSRSKTVGDAWTPKRAWENVFGKYKRLKAAGEERMFYLMYQNDPVGDGTRDFTAEIIKRATGRGEEVSFGQVPALATVVCALDPAGTGGAGLIAIGVLSDGSWQVLDALWGRNWRTEGMHERMREFGRYNPTYWVVEGQGGGWKEWADSREIKDICAEQAASHIVLSTGANKFAKDVGVASLVPEVRDRLIIPSATQADRERMRHLEYQLENYRPPQVVNGMRVAESSEPYDLLMALWLAARVIRDRHVGAKSEKPFKNYWDPGYKKFPNTGGWSKAV